MRGGGWDRRARARDRGSRWCSGVSASARAGRDALAAPPYPQLGSSNPALLRPAVNLHPTLPPLGALPGLHREAGRGSSLQSGRGCCAPRPEKHPVPTDEVTVCFFSSCPLAGEDVWGRGRKSAYAGGVWGQKPRVIRGLQVCGGGKPEKSQIRS